jgi:hypothetical protein
MTSLEEQKAKDAQAKKDEAQVKQDVAEQKDRTAAEKDKAAEAQKQQKATDAREDAEPVAVDMTKLSATPAPRVGVGDRIQFTCPKAGRWYITGYQDGFQHTVDQDGLVTVSGSHKGAFQVHAVLKDATEVVGSFWVN